MIYLNPELENWLQNAAREQGMSASQYLEKLVQNLKLDDKEFRRAVWEGRIAPKVSNEEAVKILKNIKREP